MLCERNDFDTVFAHRDGVKKNSGLKSALDEMQRIYSEARHDAALSLNYAICLIESGEFGKAEGILGELVRDEASTQSHGRWSRSILNYYATSIAARNGDAAIASIQSRLRWFGEGDRRSLICFALERLLSIESLAACKSLCSELATPIDLSPLAIRRLYEICSAKNELQYFHHLPLDRSKEEIETELAVIQLIYGSAVNESWYALIEKLRTKGTSLTPFDAYRIGLQACARFDGSMAERTVDVLSSLCQPSWECNRLLGMLAEARGDVEAALSRYHDAASMELRANGKSADTIRKIEVAEVRISCITLSYNDERLVWDFCSAIRPHCDEIIVNDGGSTDGTVREFRRFSSETGFPVHVIEDYQSNFRDRSIFSKDGYRTAGLGGVQGFQADRRRTTTLVAANYDYVLLADLDDRFERFPCMKTIVAAAYGADQFTGSKCETLDDTHFCDLYQSSNSALPTLFRKRAKHVFAGVSAADEYLAQVDMPLSMRATAFMGRNLSKCYHFWHLKFLLDQRYKSASEPKLGPKYPVGFRLHDKSLLRVPDPKEAVPGAVHPDRALAPTS